MDRDWIDRLSAHADPRLTIESADRAVQYRAVAGPRWHGIKTDIHSAVRVYNEHAGTRNTVSVEDADHRLVLRGRDFALDITFYRDKARIIGAYQSHKQRRRRQFIGLRLEMRDDGLVVIDRRGCPVEDPVRLLLEPFFKSLRDAERPTWWERSGASFPR